MKSAAAHVALVLRPSRVSDKVGVNHGVNKKYIPLSNNGIGRGYVQTYQ
jgi:hypothetical protein